MKYVWEVTDIKPTDSCGLTILGGIVENGNTTASNRFSMLGYMYAGGHPSTQLITLTSLDDGLMVRSGDVEDMVNFLNKGNYKPVMKIERIRIK